MDEEANFILRKAGYDIKPWEGFVQRGSTYGGISKEISHDKLKGLRCQNHHRMLISRALIRCDAIDSAI